MKKLLSVLTMIICFAAIAHEGHNHDDPSLNPTKGGVIKVYGKTSKCYVEVKKISKTNEVNIYLYGADAKKVRPAKDFKVSAKAMLPRKNEKIALDLVEMGDFYQTSFDKKKSHRYTLVIDIESDSKSECFKDQLDFTIE